jgi:ubiquinone/menaquinone biosynthesis C-methylase UbiE
METAMEYTERQARELEYHRDHYAGHEKKEIDFDVLDRPERRWWNAYWAMYAALKGVKGRALVVGCGDGEDAIRLAKMGLEVYAFDLSPEAIRAGRELARRHGLSVFFEEMPAEKLTYPDCFFDVLVARDILHHVDIPKSLAEMRRVSRPNALWVVNEIYSHSWTNLIRNSWPVRRVLYPIMQRFIYGPGKPYITEDERKLTQKDIEAITGSNHLKSTYFNFVVTRLLPDTWTLAVKCDRLALRVLPGKYLAGRVLLVGKCSGRS